MEVDLETVKSGSMNGLSEFIFAVGNFCKFLQNLGLAVAKDNGETILAD